MKCRSLWHSPAPFVCMRTSWGLGLSIRRSSISRSPGCSQSTAAFMSRPLGWLHVEWLCRDYARIWIAVPDESSPPILVIRTAESD